MCVGFGWLRGVTLGVGGFVGSGVWLVLVLVSWVGPFGVWFGVLFDRVIGEKRNGGGVRVTRPCGLAFGLVERDGPKLPTFFYLSEPGVRGAWICGAGFGLLGTRQEEDASGALALDVFLNVE